MSTTPSNRRRALRRSGLAVAMAIGLGTAIAVAPAAADPPGANGTIKIDGEPLDSAPNNEPHVGCIFQIDFYGFDLGAYNAGVDIAVQPPTGPFTSILTDSVFIGEDAAGGGTDVDAERDYDLASSLAGYTPHPNQGFHVKVTVDAPGAKGKIAKKSKTFWVDGCKIEL